MNRCMLTFSIVGCLLLGLAGVVRADQDADLRVEISRLKQRLNEVETKQSENWLDDRRAEEIKSLVQDVLADADTRASLMAEGTVAGHDGSHFFLASADGSFLLELAGQIQFRWISNFDGNPPVADEDDYGFQVRRTKLGFSGHVEAGGKWDYTVVLAVDRGNGDVEGEDIIIGRKLADGVKLKFGKFKLPFLREELTSSKRSLAVDRSSTGEFFTLDRSEQIQVELTPMDNLKIVGSFNDGADEEFSTIGADEVEVAFTGRVDFAIAGDLKQIKDFSAWSGEPFGAFIGGALHYQLGDAKNDGNSQGLGDADYFAWTVDGSIETNGLNVFASLTGNSVDADNQTNEVDADQLGFVIQGGYMIVPDKVEPFVRFEYLDADGVGVGAGGDDEAMLLTVGSNFYFKKHNAKLTVDVVFVLDGDDIGTVDNPFGNSHNGDGLGFADSSEDTVLIRVQFQLLF